MIMMIIMVMMSDNDDENVDEAAPMIASWRWRCGSRPA